MGGWGVGATGEGLPAYPSDLPGGRAQGGEGHTAAEPRGKRPAPGPRGGTPRPQHQAVRRHNGRPKPDPGNSAQLESYHGEDGGGVHPRFPLHWGWGQGKGSTGRSGPAAPLSGAATALPLAKMAASSHVSNRKWRGSKGGRRGAVGWGMYWYPAARQVFAKEVWGLGLQPWNLLFLSFH